VNQGGGNMALHFSKARKSDVGRWEFPNDGSGRFAQR